MEIRKGMKLYQIVFWERSGRKLEHIVIKKVNPKTVKIAWYDNWNLKKEKIGNEWFTSKEDAIKDTINKHEEGININHGKKGFQERKYKMQIKSLNRWLKRLTVDKLKKNSNLHR